MTLRMTISSEDARGIARMALRDMEEAEIPVGGTIRLRAARDVFARVAPGAVPTGTILADRTIARNCALPDGSAVEVAAVDLGRLAQVIFKIETPAATTPMDLKDALFDMALGAGDRLTLALPNGPSVDMTVLGAEPGGCGLVGEATQVLVETPADRVPGYGKVGGLSRQVAAVHEMIAAPLLRPELFRRLGIPAPRGVLFTGPPGSGKTLLARTVAHQTRASFFQIDGPEILSKHYGESEAALRRVFEAASRAQPAIIFIDEIDSLAPRRDALSGEKQVERRIVAQLLTLMDGMADRGRVVVMAATNLPDSIDPALRRPGRFDREIVFGPPTDADRREILAVHLADAPLEAGVDLDTIAAAAKGYVGADLAALASEAAMAALSRAVRAAGSEAGVAVEDLCIAQADLEEGLRRTGPSLLRGTGPAAAPIDWAAIGGLDAPKAALRQAIDLPDRHSEAMAALGLVAPRGILLTGPPGSGKTMLARALAGATDRNFIAVRPPDLVSQFLGEAERSVMALFDRARHAAPCLLFFDELDAIAPRRGTADAVFDRIVAQFLVEIDGISPGRAVTVLAATNRAASIDPALLRPGRIDRVIDLPLPDRPTRAAILRVHFGARACALDVSLDDLAALTEGLSGADLAGIADRAAWCALDRADAGGGAVTITAADVAAACAEHALRKAAERSDHITHAEDAT